MASSSTESPPCPGLHVNLGDLSDTLRPAQLYSFTDERPIFSDQASFAYHRVLGSTPLFTLCDLNRELMKLCNPRFASKWVETRKWISSRDVIAGTAQEPGKGLKSLREAAWVKSVMESAGREAPPLHRIASVTFDQRRGAELHQALSETAVAILRDAGRHEKASDPG